jgi:hypothetical protein
MARQKNNDLVKFQEFLLLEGASPRTAVVYASRVRRILKDIDSISAEALADFISKPENGRSADGYISGWNKFSRFIQNATGMILPPMKSVPRCSRSAKRPIPPIPVIESIIQLQKQYKISYRTLEALRWEHIEMRNPNTWEVKDPHQASLWYQIRAEILRPVCDWMFGDYDVKKEKPVFPASPNNGVAMSKTYMAKIVRNYKNLG